MNDSIFAIVQNGTVSTHPGQVDGFLSKMWNGIGGWQIAITVLATLMAYDQCMSLACARLQPLTANTVQYLYKKGSIAGPRFKIPFIGPFLQGINPKFEAYEAQWASGKISCVSIFHK